jgi:hypothetical protein
MEIVWAKSGWCFNHLGMDTVSNILNNYEWTKWKTSNSR